MTEIRPFADNADFLSAAMKWVDRCIAAVMAARQGGLHTVRGLAITADRAAEALDSRPARSPALGRELETLLRRAEASDAAIPLRDLWALMQATTLERVCSLAALSAAYDAKYALLYGYLNDNIQKSAPTLGCAMAFCSLFAQIEEAEAAGLFAAEEGFAAYALERPAQQDPGAELVLTDKARLLALGVDAVGAPVRAYARLLEPDGAPLEYGLEENRLPQLLLQLLDGSSNACVQLTGQAGSGRKRLLRSISAQTDLRVLCVEAAQLPGERAALEEAARRICIEALLGAELVLIDGADALEREQLEALLRELTRRMKLTLLSVETERTLRLPAGVLCIRVDFPLPDLMQSRRLWADELGDGQTAQYMADKVRMTPGRVRETAARARLDALLAGEQELTTKRLMGAVRAGAEHGMDGQARRINAFYTWDDLVVTPETARELRLFCDRVKFRSTVMEDWNFRSKLAYGKAVSALFYGVPGTGKTMAAQVIANELELDLYRVDLSQIINKYVGETEKNLSRIFDEAAGCGGILFFDEADALFAKRTEIADSKDKYANAETAFLLQKIEEFDGLVILATNLAYNFDDAFKRRVNYMVNFTKPDEAQRRELWRKVFPPQTGAAQRLDIDFLAQNFEITGSTIKSIAVSAAYMAAAEGTQIGMAHVIRALKHEYIKIGEILIKSRLREYDVE